MVDSRVRLPCLTENPKKLTIFGLDFAARHGNRALRYINFHCSYGFVHNLFTRSKTVIFFAKSLDISDFLGYNIYGREATGLTGSRL